MSGTCSCSTTLSNTGTPNCEPIMKVAKKLILVPYYDDAGAVNYIDLDDTLDQDYFDDKINETDASQRWFPLPELKNVSSEKPDDIVEQFEDGSRAFVHEAVRPFTAIIPSLSTNYLEKLKSVRCSKIGVFIVDKDGNLIGNLAEDGKLYPIYVDKNSWNAKYVMPSDSTVAKIQLTFNFGPDEKDEDLRMITSDDIDPVNLLLLEGLIDVNAVYTSPTQTGFIATITTDFGSALNPVKVKGLLVADFSLYNVTDSADITIVSVTETSDGVYVFVFASQTASDVARLSGNKSGYDFSRIDDITITL